MTREERGWVWRYSLLIAVLTTLPYLVAYMQQGTSWVFTGFLFGVEDGNSYIAKMLRGAEGSWLFRTPYTALSQTGAPVFLPYTLLGKFTVGGEPHAQLVVLFHLFRVLSLPLWTYAIYRFAALFLEEARWLRWATIVATLGGGLGWLLIAFGREVLFGSLPLEFYSPEAFGFLAAYGLPHLVLARALLLLGLTYYLAAEGRARQLFLSALAFVALGLVQPLSLVTGYAVISMHLVLVAFFTFREKDFKALAGWLRAAILAISPSAPIVLYLALASRTDAFLRQWAAQNRILSPHPAHYLLAYGLLLIPAALGAAHALRRDKVTILLPLGWILAAPLLAYAPVNIQRRLPEGVWVALTCLAALGLWGLTRSDVSWRRWVGPALMMLSLPSSIILILGGMGAALTPGPPAFRPVEEVASFNWINQNASVDSIILSSFDTGNPLPAFAPVRVVIGHGPESVGLEDLLPKVGAFYGEAASSEGRLSFLESQGVDYVYYGPSEASLGDWNPSVASYLNQVYSRAGYAIYRVQGP